MELSDVQWNRMKENSIYVKGFNEIGKTKREMKCTYTEVIVGENISFQKKTIYHKNKVLKYRRPLLWNITGGYLMIVADKGELVQSNPDLIILDCSSQDHEIDEMNQKYVASGKIVLLMVKRDHQGKLSEYTWGRKEFDILNMCKTSVINGHSSHHGSLGKYYSFGNRANYGMIENSSITQYVSKKYSSTSKTQDAEENANVIMLMSLKELQYSVTQLSKIIPNVANYISPSLDVIYKLQNEVGDLNFKAIDKDNEDNTGIWQTSICVNAETTELHCENDCTYTLIVVPKQDNDKEQSAEYNFIFDLMKGFTVGIKMDPSVCILFSGKYLLH